MLSHLFVGPVVESLDIGPMRGGWEPLFYAAACIPLAALLYYLDHRFMVWSDTRKLEWRERFRQKWE